MGRADEVGGRIAAATEAIMLQREHAKDTDHQRCVGAFVTFNNPLSLHRCLGDYSKRHWLPGRYPQPMLFDGRHRLKVTPAPE